MKTGGVNRSNIFGSTKDNHLNGDRLVFQSVCRVAEDSGTPSRAIGLFRSHQTRLRAPCDRRLQQPLWRKEEECIPIS